MTTIDQWQLDWGRRTIEDWLDMARHATALHMIRGASWPEDWSMRDRLAVAWLLEDWDQFADMGCETVEAAWGRLCCAWGWTAEAAENMWPIMEELRDEV